MLDETQFLDRGVRAVPALDRGPQFVHELVELGAVDDASVPGNLRVEGSDRAVNKSITHLDRSCKGLSTARYLPKATELLELATDVRPQKNQSQLSVL